MRMKSSFFTICTLLWLVSGVIEAKEGLWALPNLPGKLLNELEDEGIELESQDFYDEKKPSLKDQVILFNNRYSGVLLSEKGLALVNYQAVKQLLTPTERATGVTSSNDSVARVLEGFEGHILVSSENVSWRILPKINDQFDPARKAAIIDSIGQRLCAEKIIRSGYVVRMQTLGEHKFFINIYRKLPQVRLVYCPPEALAAYHRKSENAFGPMHNADFALVRLYTENGKPYECTEAATLCKTGFEENDPVLMMGYPQVRHRSLTASRLESVYLDSLYAQLFADSIITAANYRPTIARYDSLAEAQRRYKSIQTELEQKKKEEEAFTEWAANRPDFTDCLRYANLVGQIKSLCHRQRKAQARIEALQAVRSQSVLCRIVQNVSNGNLPETLPPSSRLDQDFEQLRQVFASIKSPIDSLLWTQSDFSGESRFKKTAKRWKKDRALLLQDPLFAITAKMDSTLRAIDSRLILYNEGLNIFRNSPNGSTDGDLLLRLSYGHIKGFSPTDGIRLEYCTHLSGIAEGSAYSPFSRWAQQEVAASGDRELAFWTDVDYAGERYGAAVYNDRGELLGILCNANIENLRHPYRFNAEKGRYLVCDIRFIVFMIGQEPALYRIWNELHWGNDIIHIEVSN